MLLWSKHETSSLQVARLLRDAMHDQALSVRIHASLATTGTNHIRKSLVSSVVDLSVPCGTKQYRLQNQGSFRKRLRQNLEA